MASLIDQTGRPLRSSKDNAPVRNAPGGAAPVAAASYIKDATLASFAADIVGSAQPFAVVEEDGRILGEIWSEQVIEILAGRERSL